MSDEQHIEEALAAIGKFLRGEGSRWEEVEQVFTLAQPLLERELNELIALKASSKTEELGLPVDDLPHSFEPWLPEAGLPF